MFMSKLKKIPEFKSESDERYFWQSHYSPEYVDWSKAKLARFPNLKPSTKTISLRLPESLLLCGGLMVDVPPRKYQHGWMTT
jgi:hypothetical protein